jgi:hypothetical protein
MKTTKAMRVARAQKELRLALLDQNHDRGETLRRQRSTILRLRGELARAEETIRALGKLLAEMEGGGSTVSGVPRRFGPGLKAYLGEAE